MAALISVRRGGRNNVSCLLYIPAESSVIGDTRIYELYSLLGYTGHASTVDKINLFKCYYPI